MDHRSRRHFLKDLGLGTAAISVTAEGPRASQMPGRPASGQAASHPSGPASLMAIAAHPGDAFFAMGAAVALQVHLGGAGVFLSLSLGEKGSPTIAPAEYGTMQRDAAVRAARVLGARSEFLTYPDGAIPASDEAKFAVCDMIRRFKPALIVTHWRGSWHKDHQACYEIVNDAVFYAGLPALERPEPAHAVRGIYFADNWEDAAGFTADTYLDVTPVFENWTAACAAFPMWRGETGFRYNDYYTSLAVARGCLSGFQKAVALMSPPEQLTRHLRAL
ncbi:MAG TPA: PIG-L deacetylase family protein [Terriglobia bacterium]|nr:PIG-L deacetylase family protein [Terriglobia bacterium]